MGKDYHYDGWRKYLDQRDEARADLVRERALVKRLIRERDEEWAWLKGLRDYVSKLACFKLDELTWDSKQPQCGECLSCQARDALGSKGKCGKNCLWHDGDCREQRDGQCDAPKAALEGDANQDPSEPLCRLFNTPHTGFGADCKEDDHLLCCGCKLKEDL